MNITIMIPTYNERENLQKLINSIYSVCKSNNIKPEFIIVDDNSPDGTGEIAEQLKNKYKKKFRMHIIHRKERGRGTAGIAGFKLAIQLKNKYIIEMDADFSHDPKYIPDFIKAIKKYDVVIGSRYVGFGRIEKRSFVRNVVSFFANIYIRAMLGMKIRDMSSGYKCYRKEVLESIDFSKIKSKGYSIGAEMLYIIKKKGFTLYEIPIVFRNRRAGKSKAGIGETLRYLWTILIIRLRSW